MQVPPFFFLGTGRCQSGIQLPEMVWSFWPNAFEALHSLLLKLRHGPVLAPWLFTTCLEQASHSPRYSHTHTLTHTHTHSHKHTHIHTHSHTQHSTSAHFPSPAPSCCQDLTHTHTRAHTHTYIYTHSHTLKHTT